MWDGYQLVAQTWNPGFFGRGELCSSAVQPTRDVTMLCFHGEAPSFLLSPFAWLAGRCSRLLDTCNEAAVVLYDSV